ncbi:hydroxysqualene dehydroxylase [Nocardioides jiangxiensis]|uniref:FAD-dependent oxidoreductase n=1 Tax=Nocardioides jiangxiensis TaxID=3064524 RepID=A0ABT9AYF9_9ACTN|nr:FAD-dependent oxidoreductase [Nocardioides sp. WY-20]MDO7867605.1 FAD-dependent oxidoreductase [Nocardioides sp. WY-20]
MNTSKQVTRRSVLGGSAAVAAAGVALGPMSPALAVERRKVAVLGGGMAGLSAAFELVERGYEVTVYERNALGGKARSIPVAGTAAGGRLPLPGEHGFRFFPGFYKHIPDTMTRIPFAANRNGVKDNLVAAPIPYFPRSGGRNDQQFFGFLPDPRDLMTPAAVERLVVDEWLSREGIMPDEAAYFASRLVVYLSSCDARRMGEWEKTSWWDFVGAATRSKEYQNVAARGLTRALVAAKEEIASTRTIGNMAEAFIYALAGLGTTGHADQVLDGPTNEVWIDPWVGLLRQKGVRFVTGATVTGLTVGSGRISGARARRADGTAFTITADWYVSAMPVERVARLLTAPVLALDPSLARLHNLYTDWMNGLQIFLKRKVEITRGHIAFLDSPWSITGLTQGQFWEKDFAATYGDGTAVDCLSIDISDWTTPGILYGKTAKECTRQEIFDEAWAQMKAALEDTGDSVLPDDIVHSWHLDPGIRFHPSTGSNTNEEPLLVNTVDSWKDRPTSTTRIPNFFLAGDYVRTNIDLATMEGANESGRTAANAILAASGSTATRAKIMPMYRPVEWEAFKVVDAARYRLGQKNVFDVGR